MDIRGLAAVLGVVCLIGSTGCGGDDDDARPAATPTAEAKRSATKVSANDASEAEIERALEAAGVQNAERWAHEIEEYRPYPTDDPQLSKLRKELAKYNPGPDELDRIVSALEP